MWKHYPLPLFVVILSVQQGLTSARPMPGESLSLVPLTPNNNVLGGEIVWITTVRRSTRVEIVAFYEKAIDSTEVISPSFSSLSTIEGYHNNPIASTPSTAHAGDAAWSSINWKNLLPWALIVLLLSGAGCTIYCYCTSPAPATAPPPAAPYPAPGFVLPVFVWPAFFP